MSIATVVDELRVKAAQILTAADVLASLDHGSGATPHAKTVTCKKRTVSLSARRKMALAQRARWQKVKAGKAVSKKKPGISPAGRARIAAAARARWARVKAAQRKPRLVKKVA